MRNWIGCTVGVLLALCLLGCASASSPADQPATTDAKAEAEIQALYASWREAVAASDIPAYVAVLDPEVRLLPPGAAPIIGAARYAKFLEPVFAGANYRIEVTQPQQIQVLGDIAVAEYEYIVHLKLKDESAGIAEPGALTAERSKARYFDVLRKRADGKWGVWRHLWQDQALEAL